MSIGLPHAIAAVAIGIFLLGRKSAGDGGTGGGAGIGLPLMFAPQGDGSVPGQQPVSEPVTISDTIMAAMTDSSKKTSPIVQNYPTGFSTTGDRTTVGNMPGGIPLNLMTGLSWLESNGFGGQSNMKTSGLVEAYPGAAKTIHDIPTITKKAESPTALSIFGVKSEAQIPSFAPGRLYPGQANYGVTDAYDAGEYQSYIRGESYKAGYGKMPMSKRKK